MQSGRLTSGNRQVLWRVWDVTRMDVLLNLGQRLARCAQLADPFQGKVAVPVYDNARFHEVIPFANEANQQTVAGLQFLVRN